MGHLRSDRWVVAKGSRESPFYEPVIETLNMKFSLLSPSQRMHSLHKAFNFLNCVSVLSFGVLHVYLPLFVHLLCKHFSLFCFWYGYYGHLNDNVFHRFWYLNTCSPLGGTVFVGGVDLMKGICHCGFMGVHSLAHSQFAHFALCLKLKI